MDSYVHPTFWGKVEAYTGFGFDMARDIIQMRYDLAPSVIQVTTSTATHSTSPAH